MLFKDIAKILKDIDFMEPNEGKIIYNFVRRNGFKRFLELGFVHGTSTCYIAVAIEENGLGTINAIDNKSAKERDPTIFILMQKTKLDSYIKLIFTDTSYT